MSESMTKFEMMKLPEKVGAAMARRTNSAAAMARAWLDRFMVAQERRDSQINRKTVKVPDLEFKRQKNASQQAKGGS